MKEVQLAQVLLPMIKCNGGLTYSVTTGAIPDTGFAVSIPGHEERFPWYLNESDLANYLKRHAEALKEPGAYLGAWLDNGTWYLDVSRVVSTKEIALQLGSAWDQYAVTDLSTGLGITVPTWMKWNDADAA